jgi:hypothetical protein
MAQNLSSTRMLVSAISAISGLSSRCISRRYKPRHWLTYAKHNWINRLPRSKKLSVPTPAPQPQLAKEIRLGLAPQRESSGKQSVEQLQQALKEAFEGMTVFEQERLSLLIESNW